MIRPGRRYTSIAFIYKKGTPVFPALGVFKHATYKNDVFHNMYVLMNDVYSFFLGTLAPSFRASDRPIATGCFFAGYLFTTATFKPSFFSSCKAL
jgi:hypothetical protein